MAQQAVSEKWRELLRIVHQAIICQTRPCAPSAPSCSLQGAFMGWTPGTGSQDSVLGLWCSEPGEGRAGTSSHGRLSGGGRSCWKWTSREVDVRTMMMVVACFHYSGNLVSSELWRMFPTQGLKLCLLPVSPESGGGSFTTSTTQEAVYPQYLAKL